MGHVKTTIRSLTTWAQIHDLTFRPINPPSQPRLKCLTNTRTQQSVYSKIRHFNEVQLTAAKLQRPLTVITWPYRGLRYRPTEIEFLKLSADKSLLFKWLQAQVQFFELFWKNSSYVSGASVCIFVALYLCNFVSLYLCMFGCLLQEPIRLKVLWVDA